MKLFRVLDDNGNGYVNLDEFMEHLVNQVSIGNSNGYVNFDEFKGHLVNQEGNGNGYINLDYTWIIQTIR